jgi:hypothetical protein
MWLLLLRATFLTPLCDLCRTLSLRVVAENVTPRDWDTVQALELPAVLEQELALLLQLPPPPPTPQ